MQHIIFIIKVVLVIEYYKFLKLSYSISENFYADGIPLVSAAFTFITAFTVATLFIAFIFTVTMPSLFKTNK